MKRIVALSGGKDSTAMALRLRELNPEVEFDFLCTPTGDELPEMIAHWSRLEQLLGQPLTRVTAKHDLNGLIEEFGALPNWRQRWCTRILKIEPCLAYLKSYPDAILYVGLRADEEERRGIYGGDCQVVFPLRLWGWGIREVFWYLREKKVDIPKRTDCARCYGQRLAEWKRLWQQHPEIYAHAERQEERIGNTFRSPGRDTWPASLKELRKEFEAGRPVRGENKPQDPCRVCSL
jgi:hypothetical protein